MTVNLRCVCCETPLVPFAIEAHIVHLPHREEKATNQRHAAEPVPGSKKGK